MRKHRVVAVLLLLLVALFSGSAWAADIFVATNGSDTTGNGSIGSPYATLTKAVSMAAAGDTIQVRAGSYTQHLYWDVGPNGAPGAYITIRAYDGNRTASFVGESGCGLTLTLMGRQYVKVIGLDLSGANTGNYYVVKLSSCLYVELDQCYVHNSVGGDVIKSNSDRDSYPTIQSAYVTIQESEIAYPGNTGNNQGIDTVAIDYMTYRNNYFHDLSDAAIIPKGGCHYPVSEGNVVYAPTLNGLAYAMAFGGDTDQVAMEPGAVYQSYNAVIRNNLFASCTGGALGTNDCYRGYFYNNLVYNSGGGLPYLIVQHTSNDSWTPSTDGVYVFNNSFVDTRGQMPNVYYYQGSPYSDWQHDYNNFWNNGSAIPAGSWTGFDPNQEPHSTFGNPSLSLSGGTPSTWQGWVNYLRPNWDSLSNTNLKDKGTSAAGAAPCPNVLKDIDGNVRPRDSGWDIGPYEYQGAAHIPIPEFSANQTSGSIPLVVQFTDGTAAGPTAWSWSFGDGSTSTAQSPSHTYNSFGSFNVALTAYNAAGNDTKTKTGYINAVPLTAAFTSDKTYGGAPVTVQFTDQTDNSPTAWSWSFGDSSTSTAQNPSHTFSNVGTYTVSLTAYNANGSSVCSKADYISACTEAVVYPTSYGAAGAPKVYLVSGTLADLQTEGSGYMLFRRDGYSAGDQTFTFQATTIYTQSQVRAITYEVKLHASPTTGVNTSAQSMNPADMGLSYHEAGGATVGSTDVWLPSRTETDTSKYMNAGGQVGAGLCSCNSAAQDYYLDVFRFRLYVVPGTPQAPVANFSGSPTSGSPPLSVSFTDQSANTPTSWSWTFGDSGTSTAQNPSHAYSSAGSYTVALTATNAQGNNTCTKNGYITVNSPPPAPVANFTGSPTSGSTPLVVVFTDTSTNTPTSWSWTFGDGSSSVAQNPSHTYTSDGTWTVSLTATNAGGSDGETKTNYIISSSGPPAPAAAFSGTPTTGSAPLSVTFTDASTNTPTAWSWTFGDGSTSTAQNPSHTYNSNGAYTVALTASNSGGNNTCTKTGYIAVGSSAVCYPTSTLLNQGTLASGSLSDLTADDSTYMVYDCSAAYKAVDVEHVFSTGYTPSQVNKIKVEWNLKSSRADTPPVGMKVLRADASAYDTAASPGLLGTSDVWVSWETTEVATYLTAGGGLRVRICACGYSVGQTYQLSADVIKATLTLGGTTPPVADFSGTPTSGGLPLTVSFTDASTSTPTAWSWTFGDSYTATTQNPSHTYTTAGTFTVALTATNAGGSDTETKTNYITTGAIYYPTEIYLSQGTLASGTPADLTSDDGVYMVYNCANAWKGFDLEHRFWTSHTPSQVSSFKVEWNLKSSQEDTPPVTIRALRADGSSYDVVASPGLLGTSDIWVSWETSDVATYLKTDGRIITRLCACGNAEDYQLSLDVVRVTLTLVGAVAAPVAGFSATPTYGTPPLSVSFTDTSTNAPTSWLWDFGDSTNSVMQNPSHTYNADGDYTVSLTATNAGGQDTCTKANYISVGSVSVSYATSSIYIGSLDSGTDSDLTADDGQYLVINSNTDSYKGLDVYFTFQSGYAPSQVSKLKMEWNLKSSLANSPPFTIYVIRADESGSDAAASGTLTTSEVWKSWETTNVATYLENGGRLRTNICACGSSAGQNYKISFDVVKLTVTLAAPVANFTASPTTGKVSLAVTFTDASSHAPTAWSWTFGDGGTSTAQNPSHTYTAVGLYSVALTATNAVGTDTCTKVNYITVDPPAPVADFTGNPTSGAYPLNVAFTDNSTNTPTSWSWDFGDSTSSTAQNPSHTYTSAGTNTVALTATNAGGNNTLTKTNYISVTVPPPVTNFTGTPLNGTAPLAVAFTDTSTNTPTSWSWTFGDASSSTAQNPNHTYNSAGSYTVALTATNAGGGNTNTKTNYISVTSMPTYIASGAVTYGTGAITPALPSGRQTNDILLLFLETANQAISISNQNGGTWAQVSNSPQSVGSGSSATRLTVFWSRYNGTQGAPTTSDSGDHQIGRIIAIRGAATAGSPWDVTAGGTESTADTSGSIPGATTSVANTLVVAAIATALPDANGTSNFSAWSNGDLSSVTERIDNTRNAGNGGGLGVAVGGKATAGAYTTTSVTCGTATAKAMMSIAIKP